MSAWETVALGDLATINPRDEKPGSNDKISFVGMAALDEIAAVTTHGDEREYEEVSKGYTQFRDGDILVGKITPCWENGKIGLAKLGHDVGVGSTEFHVVRPTSRLDARYAMRFLRCPAVRTNGELRMTGSGGQRRVPAQFLSSLRIPLPPLAEQRRIAAILDRVDVIRAKRRAQLVHFDGFPQALFQQMFGGLVAKNILGEVAAIQGGLQVSTKRNSLPETSKYLRVANVHRGRLDLREVKVIGLTEAERTRTRLRRGDLLFVEGHANPDEVGRVASWGGQIEECVHQNHLIRARVDETVASPKFVEEWMNSSQGRRHFQRAGKTTSGLNTISARTVRSAPLLLPRLSVQQDFTSRVAAAQTERDRVARALESDDELFAALQHRAFRRGL